MRLSGFFGDTEQVVREPGVCRLPATALAGPLLRDVDESDLRETPFPDRSCSYGFDSSRTLTHRLSVPPL